jgi:hypothetical protein
VRATAIQFGVAQKTDKSNNKTLMFADETVVVKNKSRSSG